MSALTILKVVIFLIGEGILFIAFYSAEEGTLSWFNFMAASIAFLAIYAIAIWSYRKYRRMLSFSLETDFKRQQ